LSLDISVQFGVCRVTTTLSTENTEHLLSHQTSVAQAEKAFNSFSSQPFPLGTRRMYQSKLESQPPPNPPSSTGEAPRLVLIPLDVRTILIIREAISQAFSEA
jgi:hypothetical protein